MIAVIFEVEPSGPQEQAAYFATAAALKARLDEVDGFISVERFESLTQPGRFLSLSFFRDEEAVAAWRELPEHRSAQTRGRTDLFSDYRLRVAEVLRDYGMHEREDAPSRGAERTFAAASAAPDAPAPAGEVSQTD